MYMLLLRLLLGFPVMAHLVGVGVGWGWEGGVMGGGTHTALLPFNAF